MAFVELTCISCPLGCPLRVETDDEGRVLSVTGNTCRRGEEYGRKEVTAPTRTVTSTVRLTGGGSPVVSVRTSEDIPKGKIFDVMAAIRSASVAAPVHIGDVVIPDIAGTGVDLIATAEREAV
ncbi:MAG: DUF1667 domain-containing protein [Acutalibacter sp.]|jgi:CxxC motif-containing protein|uniref:DUF1667 domain-containing protein n=1 Tax=unclassified Acutalibacter TaxID=2620728 RepID=UPI0021723ACB|nr:MULTISPECIES: DUF1667 domain-containing protein [unclassified Acutalibacter]MCI9225102.1 DUF1667 domain-containing protein [Acutalibacter sp.]